jgi:hypothetical protein
MSPIRSTIRHAALLAALALVALPTTAGAAPLPGSQSLSLQPNPLDFGVAEVEYGGNYQNVTVQNDGIDDVSLTSFAIDGPDADDFSIDWNGCQGMALSAGNSCSISVHFGPDDGSTSNATLHVYSGEQDFASALTGVGGVRRLSPAAEEVDFGSAPIGETVTRTVSFDNSGNLDFQSMVAIPTGGDIGAFRVLADGCSMVLLAPAEQCALKVRFEPFAVDVAEAQLAVIGAGQPILVKLSGVGTAPFAAPVDGKPATGRKARRARVAFDWHRGLPAPYNKGRVDLGIARCVGAVKCRVAVRTRFVTVTGHAGIKMTRVRKRIWRPGAGTAVSLALPAHAKGTPTRLIVGLRTTAAGRRTTVRRLNIALVPGKRLGPGVVVFEPAS